MQGNWRVSRFTKGGNGAGVAKQFLFKERDLTIETGAVGDPPQGPFKPRGAQGQAPKTIDWLNSDRELFGIYSLNNDELTITFTRGKGKTTDSGTHSGRPADWSSYEPSCVK